jgi:hypothetical protein
MLYEANLLPFDIVRSEGFQFSDIEIVVTLAVMAVVIVISLVLTNTTHTPNFFSCQYNQYIYISLKQL